jgi:hypothetical protein
VSIDVSDQEEKENDEKRKEEREIFHFLLSIEIELICFAAVSALLMLANSSTSCIESTNERMKKKKRDSMYHV